MTIRGLSTQFQTLLSGPDAWSPDRLRNERHEVITLDAHAAGEPLRIILKGWPSFRAKSILGCRREAISEHERYRRALMWEPRGHRDMYGALLIPPEKEDGDVGILFMHNEGYSTMCGHGIIAAMTALGEAGFLNWTGDIAIVRFDTPAGRVLARARRDQTRTVASVTFQNVPSFACLIGHELALPGMGHVAIDLAFGGAFYVIVPAAAVNVSLSGTPLPELVALCGRIKQAAASSIEIKHPEDDDLSFLYGVILTDVPEDATHHSRNLCVFANGEVDRSPTGTGVSARLAAMHARGEIGPGEVLKIESILGADSCFEVAFHDRVELGGVPAILPRVTGTGHLTGMHRFWLSDDDPIGAGFDLD